MRWFWRVGQCRHNCRAEYKSAGSLERSTKSAPVQTATVVFLCLHTHTGVRVNFYSHPEKQTLELGFSGHREKDKTCTTMEVVQNQNPALQRMWNLQRSAAQHSGRSFHVLKNSGDKNGYICLQKMKNEPAGENKSNKQQHRNKEDGSHCSEVLLWFNLSTSLFWAGTRNCTCTARSTSYIVVHPVQEVRVNTIQTGATGCPEDSCQRISSLSSACST